MTSTILTTRLEAALDGARAALRHLSDERDGDDDDITAACDRVDAVVYAINKALPMATLGDLRLHAKALKAWHAGYYGDAPDSLERLLTVLEHLPARLWDERIGPS
jgi:hypothetical protein